MAPKGWTEVPDTAGWTPVPEPSVAEPPPNLLRQAGDVAIGVGKGALRTATDVGKLVNLIPGVKAGIDLAAGVPGTTDAAVARMESAGEYKNLAQRAGGAIETAGELALPIEKIAGVASKAIPSAERAKAGFHTVMGAAKTMPVDVNVPGEIALRIQQLGERGGTTPRAVSQFLRRVTDPNQGPLLYDEARDFASNISRISADEFGRLTPVIQREMANLRVGLNKAVADAAGAAGKGKEYAAAMNEYAKAMRLKKYVDAFTAGAKRALPYAIGGGAAGLGYEAMTHLKDLFGE